MLVLIFHKSYVKSDIIPICPPEVYQVTANDHCFRQQIINLVYRSGLGNMTYFLSMHFSPDHPLFKAQRRSVLSGEKLQLADTNDAIVSRFSIQLS